MIYRTYTIRLKPSKKQTRLLNETIAIIQDFRRIYFEELRFIKDKSNGELIDIAISMNKKILQVDADIVYSELAQLSSLNDESTYVHKFEFTTNYCKYIDSVIEILNANTLFIPLIGYIRYYNPRNFEIMEKIISIRVTKTIDGKFYAGLLFTRTPSKNNNGLSLQKALALDYSSPNLYIDDKGRTPNKPTLFRNYSKELSELQWKLHNTKDNKDLHRKTLVKYVKINNKIKNQREDFLHKTSTKLANEYDYIFIENINLSNICKYKKLGKATNDNAYRKFVKMLNYKMEDRGKLLVEIDKYYPSTRKCHCCGYVRGHLNLDQREWVCPKCGVTHDRDINAAINIKNRGIEIVSMKAAGQSVCNRA